MQSGCRPDRLVRFLRVLGFAAIQIRTFRQCLGAEVARDDLAQFGDRIVADAHRIGTHIGDQTDRAFAADRHTFIQALRQAHGAAGGKSKFARRFLLQGRRGERWRWAALAFLGLHFGNDQTALRRLEQGAARGLRIGVVGQIELLELLAAQLQQACGKAQIRMRAVGLDRPVLARVERFDFFLALRDHAQRRRLHASGGQSSLHLAPQHRRQIEADQVIQRAPRLLGVHQIQRQLARIGNGFGDRVWRNLGKHYAMQGLAFEQLALAQDFGDMPGNGFAFAIQVGCQIQGVGLGRGLGDRIDMFFIALDDFIGHREIVVGIDCAFLRPQVAHVAVGCQHVEILAEVFVDRLGLGWRFDDEQIFCHERFHCHVAAGSSASSRRA